MTRRFDVVSPDISARQLFAQYFLARRRTSFVVARNRKFVGVVDAARLREVPKELWSKTPVSKIMATGVVPAKPGENAFSALVKMLEQELELLPVISDGKLVGVVEKQALASVIQVKKEFS